MVDEIDVHEETRYSHFYCPITNKDYRICIPPGICSNTTLFSSFIIKNGKGGGKDFIKDISPTVIPGDLRAYRHPGEYIFTVPDGVTRVKVACIGGGSYNSGLALQDINIGGTSSFGNYLSAKTSTTPRGVSHSEYVGYILGFDKKIIRRDDDRFDTSSNFICGVSVGDPLFEIAEYKVADINVTPGEKIKCVVGIGGRDASTNNNLKGDGLVLVGWGSALEYVDVEDIQFNMPKELHVGDYVDFSSAKILPENSNAARYNFPFTISIWGNDSSHIEYVRKDNVLRPHKFDGFKVIKAGNIRLGITILNCIGFYQHNFHKYYEINILP